MIVVPAGQNTELVGRYVAEKCGVEFQFGLYQALAILDDTGAFVAGVVVSEWRGHDCQISCATESSAAWRPQVMAGVFDYVFNQLGCVRCTSVTKKSNKRCRDFLVGLGFQLEGRMRMAYDGVKDALVYGLLASECRYIQGDTDGSTEVPDTASTPGSDDDEGSEERVSAIPSAGATEVGNGSAKDEFWNF
jgi:hypothetical protein